MATTIPFNSRLRVTLSPGTPHSGATHKISVRDIRRATDIAPTTACMLSSVSAPKAHAKLSPSMMPLPASITSVPPLVGPDSGKMDVMAYLLPKAFADGSTPPSSRCAADVADATAAAAATATRDSSSIKSIILFIDCEHTHGE